MTVYANFYNKINIKVKFFKFLMNGLNKVIYYLIINSYTTFKYFVKSPKK